jgi:hypothetical protein
MTLPHRPQDRKLIEGTKKGHSEADCRIRNQVADPTDVGPDILIAQRTVTFAGVSIAATRGRLGKLTLASGRLPTDACKKST